MSLLYRDYRPILAFVKCNYRLTLCVFFIKKKAKVAFYKRHYRVWTYVLKWHYSQIKKKNC